MVALVAGGVWLYHEHVTSKLIDAGRSAQRLEDAKALDNLKTNRDEAQALIESRAEEAKKSYDQEKADFEAYQVAHPIISAVQLCQQSPAAHRGSGDLHAASGANGGAGSAATNGKVLQPVYPSDSPGAADRLRLLDGLGGLCDSLSARIRESQHR